MLRRLSLFAFLVLLAGCGKSEKLHDVSGKVLLDDQPLPMGTVTFVPDKSKGNNAKASCVGAVQADGTYSLGYEGKSGVPAGWYKVGVSASGMPTTMPEMGKPMPVAPKIAGKYANPETSGISIEVPSSSGDAYTI